MNATDWITAISSALMVIITYMYVKATIHISESNKESAEASRKQIEESQKQQKQNVGLQLYAMRKEVISKLSNKQYNEVYWDIPLLFDDDLFSKYLNITDKVNRIETLQTLINSFENELGLLVGTRLSDHIRQLRETAILTGDFSIVKNATSGAIKNVETSSDLTKHVDEYIRQIDEAHTLEKLRSIETTQYIIALNDFVRKSIQ